ncbi:structural protein with Ig domain [Stenotrophomonas phage Pokken]|uniref:Capsid decoration protein n=1 Tax=Stenotrophomonas phage Pokken TaxID=2596674 RepID=A0A5B9N4X3_9CAUD|nr:structural protein with Ig domain [Stenotrophomonas phage Pokken]QEG09247.1 capsid decoration protein [Stenotrophomonas phage Pokken]
MPVLQVAYKEAAPKVALVQIDGTTLPSGYVDAGSFDHPDPVYPGSLVLYHGVRDALYHFKQLNMGEVEIQLDDDVVASYVTSIDVPWGGRDLRLDDPLYITDRLNARAWPPGAGDTSLTYESSDPTIVSVSDEGVLTARKKGTATITITAPGSEGTTKLTKKVTVTVGGSAENPPPPIAVTGVTVTPTTASKQVGQTQQLTAEVAPANASNKKVNWSTSDATKATVSATGLVTAVAAGSATITATTEDGAKKATSTITVTAATVAVTGVTVAPTTSSKAMGETQQLTPTIAPANATNKGVSYSSATPAVATVNTAGLVTAVSAGTSVITVKTSDGDKTATHTITVTAN